MHARKCSEMGARQLATAAALSLSGPRIRHHEQVHALERHAVVPPESRNSVGSVPLSWQAFVPTVAAVAPQTAEISPYVLCANKYFQDLRIFAQISDCQAT